MSARRHFQFADQATTVIPSGARNLSPPTCPCTSFRAEGGISPTFTHRREIPRANGALGMTVRWSTQTQIPPRCISFLDESHLLTATPSLDLFFSGDSCPDTRMRLVPHQLGHVVVTGEPGNSLILVLSHANHQIVRHSNIQNARLAGHDVRVKRPVARHFHLTQPKHNRHSERSEESLFDQSIRRYFSSPASSEKSAMVVNSRSNSASNASRFFRTASSSAITITSTKNWSTTFRKPAISSSAS